MNKHLNDWTAILSRPTSFRRIYELSAALAEDHCAEPEARSAARRVVRTLRDVIDLPVADARILAKGRKQFLKLSVLVLGGRSQWPISKSQNKSGQRVMVTIPSD